MKTITVTLDDETYRRAQVRAAEMNTSVSDLVRRFLVDFASGGSESERLPREEARLRASIGVFAAADRLGRDVIHRR